MINKQENITNPLMVSFHEISPFLMYSKKLSGVIIVTLKIDQNWQTWAAYGKMA